MGRIMEKIVLMFLILSSFFLVPLMTTDVEALEPKLLCKKEFKAKSSYQSTSNLQLQKEVSR